jgi:hypothetical protein
MEQYPVPYQVKKMTRLLKYYINEFVKYVSIVVFFAELFCKQHIPPKKQRLLSVKM